MSALCCDAGDCGQDCLQLTPREAEVCEAVCNSSEPVSFSDVRKRLGYHQEIVSRILKRLLNHGAIEKDNGRYRASQ